MNILSILMVGIGGFVGSCSRYMLTIMFEKSNAEFPFGTLMSNVIAALLIGFIIGMERQSPVLSHNVKLFLTTGLLGGLSTFSTFSMETVYYFENGKFILAAGNILLNLGLCLVCVCIGLAVSRLLVKNA